jgi:hypothetical protein
MFTALRQLLQEQVGRLLQQTGQQNDDDGDSVDGTSYSPIHPFTHSPIHPFTPSLLHPFTN